MKKQIVTIESPPQPSQQPHQRRRNIYDYDGEYEFPTVQHWTAPTAHPSVQAPRGQPASARAR